MTTMDMHIHDDREKTLDDALRAALKRHGLPVSAPMMMWARMRLEQYALEQRERSA